MQVVRSRRALRKLVTMIDRRRRHGGSYYDDDGGIEGTVESLINAGRPSDDRLRRDLGTAVNDKGFRGALVAIEKNTFKDEVYITETRLSQLMLQ